MSNPQVPLLNWRRVVATSTTLVAHLALFGVLMLPPEPQPLSTRTAQVEPPPIVDIVVPPPPPPPPPPPVAQEVRVAPPRAQPATIANPRVPAAQTAPIEAPALVADQGETPAPPPMPPAPAVPVAAADGGAEFISYGADARPPIYPIQAMRRGIEGTVIVQVLVGVDGRVIDTRLQQKVHPLLDRAALQAVQNWQFRPASRNGVAYPDWASVPVRFVLDR
ncbi:MAG: energy transducer TonB [Xanthomonadales bacterium]|nr:energy transducer TonB [Xanthomonadales bacterium]